jgi:hypothetical protein
LSRCRGPISVKALGQAIGGKREKKSLKERAVTRRDSIEPKEKLLFRELIGTCLKQIQALKLMSARMVGVVLSAFFCNSDEAEVEGANVRIPFF